MLEDTNADGTMDKRTVFADGLELARALKVLDHGVLVGEPPNVWLMRDTNGDLKNGHERKGHRRLRTARGPRRAERERASTGRSTTGCTPPTATCCLRLKNGKFEVQKTLVARRVGRDARRRRARLSQHEQSALHVDFVPTAYFARNPKLQRTRGSYEAIGESRRQYRVAGAAESRHQPRLSVRHRRAPTARSKVHVSLRARGLSRRPAAGGALRQRLRRRAAANLVSRLIVERRRHHARREQSVRAGRVPRVDRRAIPSRLPVHRARRHAVHRRHVPRRHPATRRHHRVSARSHRQAQARGGDRAGTHLPGRARDHASANARRRCRRRRRRSSSRRCRIPTAGGAIRRSGCSSNAAPRPPCRRSRSSPSRQRIRADASPRALDARRHGRDRRRHGDQSARRRVARCPRIGRASGGAVAWRAGASDPGGDSGARRRRGLVGARTIGGVARRVAGGPARNRARVAARKARGRSDRDGCRAQRRSWQRNGGARQAAAGRRRANRRSARPPSRWWRRWSSEARWMRSIQNLFTWITDEAARAGSGRRMLRGAEVALNVAGAQPPGNRGVAVAGRRRGARRARRQNAAAASGRADRRRPHRRVRPVLVDALARAAPTRFRKSPQAAGRRPRTRRWPGLRLNTEPAMLSTLAAQGGELGTASDGAARRASSGRQARRCGADRAAHAGRAAALQCRQRGLQEHLHRVPSAGRPWPGQDRAESDRLRPRARAGEVTARILLNGKEGTVGLMPPRRRHAERRSDRGRPDVRPPRVGPAGHPGRGLDGQGRPCAETAGRTRPWTHERADAQYLREARRSCPGPRACRGRCRRHYARDHLVTGLPLDGRHHRVVRLAVRLHGPAAVHPRARVGPEGAARRPSGCRDQDLQRLRDDVDDSRLGDRRHHLRHDERPLGPRENDGRDASGVLGLHGAVGLCADAGWTSRCTGSSSGSASAGCSARRRRSWPKACRATFAPWRSARCRRSRRWATSWVAHQPADPAGRARIHAAATPAGACSSSSAFCLRCWSFRSSSCSRTGVVVEARRPTAAGGGAQERRVADRAVPPPAMAPQHASSACCSACPA